MLKVIESVIQRLKNDYAALHTTSDISREEVNAYLNSSSNISFITTNNHKVARRTFTMVFAMALFLVFTACRKDSEALLEIDGTTTAAPTTAYNNVDQDLWIYLQRFEEEGAERGWKIDLNGFGLTGEIDEIDQEHVAGQCTYSSHHPNHILIDATFFENTSELGREFIIFHELGHCVLGRDHEERRHADGTCQSLMRSGLEDCIDNYNSNTRSDYLDELFERAGA